MEGVSASRVEAHRLRHLIHRALRLVEESDQKELLYQIAGDLIISVPRRLDILDTMLDKTSYALSIMGQDFFCVVDYPCKNGLKFRNPWSKPIDYKKNPQKELLVCGHMKMNKFLARRVAFLFWREILKINLVSKRMYHLHMEIRGVFRRGI